MRNGEIAGAWSPDSKWLAYSKVLPNELSAIHLYSLADGKSTQVTDGLSDATNPVFDRDGKYLYFTASTNSGRSLGTRYSRGGAHVDQLHLSRRSGQDAALPVRARERRGEGRRRQEAGGCCHPAQRRRTAAKPAEPPNRSPAADIKVDLDGIDQRILSVPMPARRYTALQVAKAGTLLALEAPSGGWSRRQVPGMIVHRYDLKTRRATSRSVA